jgi:hypothetical protein
MVFLLAPLAGCKTGPLYRPYDGSVGYSETMLTPDTWEVSFNGGSHTAPSRATYLATVRAAELAAGNDKPHFRIENLNRHDLIRQRYDPGTHDTYYYTDSKGRVHSYTTYTPGSTITYTVPVSTLIVKLLQEPIEGSLETRVVLEDARGKGVIIGPGALDWLGRLPTTSPATTAASPG